MDETLRTDQFELLWDAERISDDGDEPVVVSEDALNHVRKALGIPLKELGMREEAIQNMSLEALAAQFTTDDDAEDEPLTPLALSQQPETGGESADDLAGKAEDEPEGVEALSAETRSEVKDKLERAETFGHRLPEHCENLRQEAVDLVPGAETVADIDLDEL